MKAPLKTADVCRLLGLRYFTLFNMIRYQTITPPARDSAGHYVWWPKDVQRVRKALCAKKEARPT
jgi:hypothetical protein